MGEDDLAGLVAGFLENHPDFEKGDLSHDQFSSISKLVETQVWYERLIVRISDAEAQAKSNLRIAQAKLVEAMTEARIPTFTFLDGNQEKTVSIKTAVSAKIAPGMEADAAKWFIDNGLEGLLSMTVNIKLPRGSADLVAEADRLKHELSDKGLKAEATGIIHHATLASFMRKALAEDNPVIPPMSVVPYTTYRYTEVK